VIGGIIIEDQGIQGVLVGIVIDLDIQLGDNIHYHSKKADPSISLVKHKRRRFELHCLQGEIQNIKPPTFDGEHRKSEFIEAWLFGLTKYLHL
jgi:hypothetical protein